MSKHEGQGPISAAGTTINIQGSYRVRIRVGKKYAFVKFLISDDVPEACILGTDAMMKFGHWTIDLARNAIWLGTFRLPIIDLVSKIEVLETLVAETVEVPPFSTKRIKLEIPIFDKTCGNPAHKDCKPRKPPKLLVIDPHPNLSLVTNLIPLSALVSGNATYFTDVMNPTEHPVTLDNPPTRKPRP